MSSSLSFDGPSVGAHHRTVHFRFRPALRTLPGQLFSCLGALLATSFVVAVAHAQTPETEATSTSRNADEVSGTAPSSEPAVEAPLAPAVAGTSVAPAVAGTPVSHPASEGSPASASEVASPPGATVASSPASDMQFVESNVVAPAERGGFRWQDEKYGFVLSPFVLAQTRAQFQVVDDEGLSLDDPDNVTGVGFGVPFALIGFAGKAFEKLSFNLTLNGACAGRGCLLNQAWLEGNVSREFRVRVGKFKTPMHWASLSRIGQKLAAELPTSLLTPVNAPADLNANNPSFATGFDLGVMVHGMLWERLEYQLGVFNGEGINVNSPTSSLSDDTGVPGLLYAARLAWQPLGEMALAAGGEDTSDPTRLLFAVSSSLNVEANAESSDDFRTGVEMVASSGPIYAALEGYAMHVAFLERQRDLPNLLYLGAYAESGYSLPFGLEPFVRMEVFDRNSTDLAGVLLLPTLGTNYYFVGDHLKLQAHYQLLLPVGHENQAQAQDDDNSMAEHTVMAQLQFSL